MGRRYGSDGGCVGLYHEGGSFKTCVCLFLLSPSLPSFTLNFVPCSANPHQIQESHSRQKWCAPKQQRTTTGSSRRCLAMENSSLLDSLSSRPRGGNQVKGRRTILMCVLGYSSCTAGCLLFLSMSLGTLEAVFLTWLSCVLLTRCYVFVSRTGVLCHRRRCEPQSARNDISTHNRRDVPCSAW